MFSQHTFRNTDVTRDKGEHAEAFLFMTHLHKTKDCIISVQNQRERACMPSPPPYLNATETCNLLKGVVEKVRIIQGVLFTLLLQIHIRSERVISRGSSTCSPYCPLYGLGVDNLLSSVFTVAKRPIPPMDLVHLRTLLQHKTPN